MQYSIITNICYKPRAYHNYFNADYEKNMDELERLDWDGKFSTCVHIERQFTAFYFELRTLIDKFAPKRHARKSDTPSWFTSTLIKLLAKKELRRKFHKINNPRDELEYHRILSDCNKLYRRCYSNYKSQLETNISNNPECFWSYIKLTQRSIDYSQHVFKWYHR